MNMPRIVSVLSSIILGTILKKTRTLFSCFGESLGKD